MDNNTLLDLKLKELEEKHRKEIDKLVARNDKLKVLMDFKFAKDLILKNKLYIIIYSTGMNACVVSILAVLSFMISMGTLGILFISIDIIIFIYTIVSSVKTIIDIYKNKKQRKKYERESNEILEEMTVLKYQYFRERRSINEQYSKNNIVDTTISKDYQNKNYVTKEQEKKLVKIKKREL